MKKLLALLLALVMVLSLCACGKRSDKDDAEDTAGEKITQEKSSHTDPLDLYVEVVMHQKYDKIEDMAPQAYWDFLEKKGLGCDELIGQMKEQQTLESYLAAQQEYFGDDVEMTIDVLNVEEMVPEELEKIAEALEESYGVNADSVKAGKIMEAEMALEGSEGEDSAEREVLVVKIDGIWYWVDWYVVDGQDYIDFVLFQ